MIGNKELLLENKTVKVPVITSAISNGSKNNVPTAPNACAYSLYISYRGKPQSDYIMVEYYFEGDNTNNPANSSFCQSNYDSWDNTMIGVMQSPYNEKRFKSVRMRWSDKDKKPLSDWSEWFDCTQTGTTCTSGGGLYEPD